ncbi:hypothetical protein GQ54DRAFT_179568 [Martensiomyces pterosporus]|nr:hypothetical protein GQ54DRAFT_179568 [Martensiomyces pterosporus]
MLSIDERILIHETMFSGQRQKKGMSKVDEYFEQLRDKSFHLKPIEFSDKDAFATATPFNITSNLMWETMRTVFSSTRRSAQAAKLNRSACKRTIHGDDEAPADSSLEDQSTLSFRIECDIYTQVCHSPPGNLHQMSDSLSKDAPAKMAGRAITQSRTRSGTQSQVPSETQKPARKQRSHERPRRATRPAQPQPLAESSEESSLSTRMWRRILTPLPKRHSERRKLGSSEAKTPPPSSSRHSHRHSHRRSHKGSRSNDDQHESAYHAAPLPGSMASSELSRERMPQRETAGSNPASSNIAGSSSSASDSLLSVRSAIAKTGVIGPAQFESGGPRRTTVFRYTQQQLRNAVRGTDTDTQKSEVAVLNRKAAVELMDCILERVWQFGALWEDLHIGEFLNVQPNSVEDLCHMWLVWVNLLGSPLEAERHRSEIILHGIVQCWDVYRAVLDCSRSRIDNDNVLLNTAWWIIETATKFSASDDRGHIAQTAIFRMGCRGLEHLSSKFLRLHSCFFQTVLIALSPLARGLRFNTSQIKTFFTECRSLISIGNPGVHLTLLSLDMALRRLFLKGSTLDGPIPEPAIQGAATLLVSMSTLLSSDRVINANHTHPKIRLLTDSNMVETLEGTDRLAGIVDELPKAKYPIIYDPLGERNYFVSWEEGGPIFGRSCETLWIMLAQPNILGSFAQSCQSHVEQTAVAGLAVICFTELKIANKSLQNSRLIDNCLTAIVSRLFSVQRDTVRAVTTILHFFVIGQADIIGFLGDERARFLTLGIMKATVEQFDRCAGNFMIDDALTIWDLARLLNALLITAPNLITKERPDGEGTQGESIRDFLVEKIMKCCAHPPQSKDAASHQYNQQLVWRQTNKGVVLSLEHAHHTSPPSDNSDASSGHASDSGHSSALALDNIKQVGEILYINLLLRFDEDDRFQYQGAPGSGFERTHIDPYTEESLDSDQLFIYGHGNNILTLHNEGNSECRCMAQTAYYILASV